MPSSVCSVRLRRNSVSRTRTLCTLWLKKSPVSLCNLDETDDDIYYDSIIKVVYGSYMWGDESYGGYYCDSVDGYDFDDNCLVPAICIAK